MHNEILVVQYIAELNRLYKAENAVAHIYRPALQRFIGN